MKLYPPHPFAELFPMMSDQGMDALVKDIKARGLLQDIILFEGMVLDGRHRQAACELAGVQPRYKTFPGKEPDALNYVLSLNLMRRDLTESQRAMIAAGLVTTKWGGDRTSEQGAALHLALESVTKAAEKVGVSERMVKAAKRLLSEDVDEQLADLAQSSEWPKTTVSDAESICDLDKGAQGDVVEKFLGGGFTTLKAARLALAEEAAEKAQEAAQEAREEAEGTEAPEAEEAAQEAEEAAQEAEEEADKAAKKARKPRKKAEKKDPSIPDAISVGVPDQSGGPDPLVQEVIDTLKGPDPIIALASRIRLLEDDKEALGELADSLKADNDESGAGEKYAKASGVPYWMPPERGDANDLYQAEGLEALSDPLMAFRRGARLG